MIYKNSAGWVKFRVFIDLLRLRRGMWKDQSKKINILGDGELQDCPPVLAGQYII